MNNPTVGVGVLDDPSAIGRLPLAWQRTVREVVPYDSTDPDVVLRRKQIVKNLLSHW